MLDLLLILVLVYFVTFAVRNMIAAVRADARAERLRQSGVQQDAQIHVRPPATQNGPEGPLRSDDVEDAKFRDLP